MIRARLSWVLIALLLASLACQTVPRAWSPQPTATPSPAATSTATDTATPVPPTPTQTETPLPTATYTQTPVPPTSTATSTPTATPKELTREEQSQVFEELWKVVKSEYLYRDFNGLDWNAVLTETDRKIRAGMQTEVFYRAMEDLVQGLGDEHSTYFTPDEAAQEDAEFAGEFQFSGIGVLTTLVPEHQHIVIVLIFPDSPAESAGLAIHDSILAVDGRPIIDSQGYHGNWLQGPAGSDLLLTVQSPGEAPRDVLITRQLIHGEIPVPYDLLYTQSKLRVGYILIPTFNDVTIDEKVGKAIKSLNIYGELDGIILDNRENGGGANDVLEGTLAYFTHGTLGQFINRKDKFPLHVNAINLNNSQEIPLVVLVGKGTASFGEIFSGILKDNGRAYLIGEQTDGNVEILWIYDFSDGSRLWLAHGTFQPSFHPEQNWEETGILPDLVVESKWDEFTTDTDPAVLAALDYFDQLSKLNP